MTELDRKLKEMAANDWNRFVAMMGEDALTSAKICMLRQEGKTFNQISIKLNVTQMRARVACSKCDIEQVRCAATG